MKRIRSLIIIPAALLIISCAPSLMPVSVPEGMVDIESQSLTLTKEDITITVFADAWRFDPIEVRSTFTPFLIAVTNNTDQDIIIEADSIFMYDENNIQYGVIPAETVDRASVPSRAYAPLFYWDDGYYHRGRWGFGLSHTYPYDRYDSNVVPLAFRLGPVTARAKAHGFVYLQKLSSNAVNIRVVVTPHTENGKTITFTFPFMVER